MIQDERHSLSARQTMQRLFDDLALILLLHVITGRFGRRNLESKIVVLLALEHLRKKPPAAAIAREVIEAEIGRDRFEPTADGGAIAQVGEALVSLQENLLRNVLGLALVGQQAERGG